MIPLNLALMFLAGMFNAVMDILHVRSKWNTSVWANKDNWWTRWAGPDSWKNKWKDGSASKGERFWGSSRWFSFVTDGWHFFQMLWSTTFLIVVLIYEPMWDWWGWPIWACYIIEFAILKVVYTASFEIFYGHIFKRNN